METIVIPVLPCDNYYILLILNRFGSVSFQECAIFPVFVRDFFPDGKIERRARKAWRGRERRGSLSRPNCQAFHKEARPF
ncbi:MAG: hypothetical protein V4508_05185 [Pseudomonadota bacterium]